MLVTKQNHFSPRIYLYLTSQNRISFSCFTIFTQFTIYVLRLLSASQDRDRLSSNTYPCIQWKLHFHNEELKTRFHVFHHLPSLFYLSILSLFQINSFYFSQWVQSLIHFTFLLLFPVLNFHSTKLINELQELGNKKQYLQNLFFTNVSVSLHLGLLSRVCASLWEYEMCHILSTNTVIQQSFQYSEKSMLSILMTTLLPQACYRWCRALWQTVPLSDDTS